VFGDAGNDLFGGAGTDSLFSGAGTDILSGDAGEDIVTGGLHDDKIAIGAANGVRSGSITDFAGGVDAVDLTGIAVLGGLGTSTVISTNGADLTATARHVMSERSCRQPHGPVATGPHERIRPSEYLLWAVRVRDLSAISFHFCSRAVGCSCRLGAVRSQAGPT
jgi:hypothetical protein